MFPLLRKEVSGFFNSFTGYIIILVFLVSNSLFMWIFKGPMNILENGYASLDTLFLMAPWVFLFLVPAITMRMFSDENKSGTIELLLTRPVSDNRIILAKYIAAMILITLALIPTLVYYWSVSRLGNPQGNLDTGAIWGSYLGLLLLSGIYAAIGLFTSSLSDNQIVSFVIAVLISFFFYIGFDSITSLDLLGRFDNILVKMGINDHYQSISRGIVDSRDLIYFFSISGIFLLMTRLVIQSRKW